MEGKDLIDKLFGKHRIYFILMGLIGIGFILSFDFKVPSVSYEFRIFVTAIVLTVVAAALYLTNVMEMYHYVSIITVTYGASTFLISYSGIEDGSLIITVVSLAKVMLSVIMVIAGIMLYSGERYNIHRMKFISFGLFVTLLIPLIFNLAYTENTTLWNEIVRVKGDMFMLLYLLIIFAMLNQRTIRYYSDMKRIKLDIFNIGNQKMGGRYTCIYREDLRSFLSDDSWTDVGLGPIVRQKSLKMDFRTGTTELVFSEWNDGRIHADVVQSNADTHIQAVRFIYKDYRLNGDFDTCQKITIYGEDGFFIVLPIEDEIEKMKNDRLHRFLKAVMNYQE